MYVIACTDLHVVIGPFDTWEEAEARAIKTTETSGVGCVFVTVPFWVIEKPKKQTKLPPQGGGGYL